MEQAIKQFRGDFFFLSNFYECPVTYKQLTYTNNEAAFQAQKCTSDSEKIQFTKLNPSEAKKLGRRVNLRKDWEAVKVKIMEEIVREKFTQNTELADKLLATGDAYLEEGNTWGDRIWGTVNGSGANRLGVILMQIRAELKDDLQLPFYCYGVTVTVTQRAWQRGRFSSGGVLSPSLKPSGEQVQGRALPPRESHVYL